MTAGTDRQHGTAGCGHLPGQKPGGMSVRFRPVSPAGRIRSPSDFLSYCSADSRERPPPGFVPCSRRNTARQVDARECLTPGRAVQIGPAPPGQEGCSEERRSPRSLLQSLHLLRKKHKDLRLYPAGGSQQAMPGRSGLCGTKDKEEQHAGRKKTQLGYRTWPAVMAGR